MASLAAQAKSYKNKKAKATKLRMKSERKLKEARSQKRRSSSGIASLERKKESTIRQRDHIVQLLNQALAQKESLGRLKTAAEERIRQEQDARDQVKQQSEYGGPDEKAAAMERLKFIDEKIRELRAEIRERDVAEARLVNTIASYEKEKSKVDQKLKKEIHAKPALVEQLKDSTKAEAMLRPRVQSLIKRETQAGKALAITRRKLAAIQKMAKRRKARRKAKRKARTKARKAKRKTAKRKPKTRAKRSQKRKKAKRKTRARSRKRRVTRRRSKSRRRK